ncbi:MAG: YHYH domain-containing protein [Bacteriovoracaceae bacterium]|nr:YHYH domain-containing protein [Bacteriovoracaceae bacterium]
MKLLTPLTLLISLSAIAHSGGTDSNGCHHDRKNGGYHCHKSDDVTKQSKVKTRVPASVNGNKKHIKSSAKAAANK